MVFTQKMKRIIAKVSLCTVAIASQFSAFFTSEKIIGYPFNFLSYSGKFDTYTFFWSRFFYSFIFWVFIINVFLAIMKRLLSDSRA
jgi:membrane-associated protease RseP (regulator of RpoE activity)